MRDFGLDLPHACSNCGAGYYGETPARLCCRVSGGGE